MYVYCVHTFVTVRQHCYFAPIYERRESSRTKQWHYALFSAWFFNRVVSTRILILHVALDMELLLITNKYRNAVRARTLKLSPLYQRLIDNTYPCRSNISNKNCYDDFACDRNFCCWLLVVHRFKRYFRNSWKKLFREEYEFVIYVCLVYCISCLYVYIHMSAVY